jgi:hypothetical protein
MSEKLDQTGEPNLVTLNRYSKLYGFPEYVKKASVDEVTTPKENKPTLFADPVRREFPVHSKAATYVSTMFYLNNEDQVNPKYRPMVEDRLDKCAQYWGITADIDELNGKHERLQKNAAPDSAYAIVFATDSGTKERRYPLRNALEVKAAAEWFSSNLPQLRQEFLFSDRQTIASKILKKAEDLGVNIRDEAETLQKSAGLGIGSPARISQAIRNRVKAATKLTPGIDVMMDSMAKVVESQAPLFFRDPANMTKLAQTIEQFDREYHLINKYSPGVPSVEELLFEHTHEKIANLRDNSVQTLSGAVYTNDQFAKLSFSDVKDLFGDDIASEVCTGLELDPVKFAEVAATLPRPDAVSLDDLMAEKGMHPLTKDASHVGFSFPELKQLASV